MKSIKYIIISLLIILSFAIGYIIPIVLKGEPELTVQNTTVDLDNELLFVYIGSSTCGFCAAEKNYINVNKWIKETKNISDSLNLNVNYVGVSKDWDIDEGYNHLKKFNKFDEVITGRSWYGIGIYKFVWQDNPGSASTPQIIFLKREFTPQTNEQYPKLISKETELVRYTGERSIENINLNDVFELYGRP